MRQPSSVLTWSGTGRFSTRALTFVGFTWFASGLFVLGAAGNTYPWAVYALLLGSSVALALPLALLMWLVAVSEAVLGRAWANGLRPLEAGDRRGRATAARGLRYSAVLWLANGTAFWLASVLTQF